MSGPFLTRLPKQFRCPEAYHSTFYDSFGNVHRSRLEIEGDVIRWIGVSWGASMDVTLRKVAWGK